MKFTQETLPKSLVQFTIEDTKEVYNTWRNKAIKEFKKNVQVPGFRKWAEVPEKLVIKEIWEMRIADHAIDMYMRSVYGQVLKESKIQPITQGELVNITSFDPLIIVVQVEVLPVAKIDIPAVDAIKLTKTESTVSEEEVDTAIKDIEKRFTHFHEVHADAEDGFSNTNTTVELGDRVTIDTQGFESQGGNTIEETKVTAFPLVIGSNQFIPGFEEKLLGHKIGDVVEFDITFPSDYGHADFQNRNVYFVTTIFNLEKSHKPEWTPKFIKDLRGVETDMPGFRDILKKELLEEKERTAREGDEKVLLEQLNKHTELEIGEKMLSEEIEQIFKEQTAHMESNGVNIESYLAYVQMSESDYKKEVITPEAERRIRAEIILKTIREQRGTEASESEIQTEIETIIGRYQNADVIERLRNKLVPGDSYYEDIKVRLAYRQIVDSFFA